MTTEKPANIVNAFQQSVAQLTGSEAPWAIDTKTVNHIDYRFYKNAPTTLMALINEGRKHGENEFIIYEGERISFDEFFKRADTLSIALTKKFAITSGDTVAIAMRNYPEWMISFVAIAQTGATVVPLNSWGKSAELVHALKDSGAKVAFMDQARFDLVAGALDDLGTTAIIAKPEAQSSNSVDELIAEFSADLTESTTFDDKAGTDDLAIMMYTSGTTGLPKGTLSTHQNVCQSIFNFELLAIATAMTDSEPVGKMLERGFPPKVLLSVPLFHVAGAYSVFLLSLRAGRPIVMMHKWDKIKALEYIQNERCTMMSAVPTMLMELLECKEWNDYDTSSMFGFGAGGSVQPARLPKTIYQKLPDSYPGTGYGMTESNACGFAATGAIFAQYPTSTGIASPILDCKILDNQGNECPQGEPGEIYLKSPTIAKGYNNQPEATKETFIDGWLKTGDIGYLNDDGYLFITDRIKDMIIRGGENIYSVEVEAAALTHEQILEAAAFGLPHDTLGEELALAVYVEANALSEEAIQQHIASQLAGFKVPSRVFIESQPLPKNATQKILKNKIKESALEVVS
ncbi:MAG: class I adenylate-forming enzyme family protein [Cellvibrionales bacterium]|nr:class I adenylate-forming enzyme family protein [Cellvibrionales bacterium]